MFVCTWKYPRNIVYQQTQPSSTTTMNANPSAMTTMTSLLPAPTSLVPTSHNIDGHLSLSTNLTAPNGNACGYKRATSQAFYVIDDHLGLQNNLGKFLIHCFTVLLLLTSFVYSFVGLISLLPTTPHYTDNRQRQGRDDSGRVQKAHAAGYTQGKHQPVKLPRHRLLPKLLNNDI
jgi:hypothetical protein